MQSAALLITALLAASAGATAAPVAVSFRFSISSLSIFSGGNLDDCHLLLGGADNEKCTGGLPDAELVARRYDAALPPQMPAVNGTSGAPDFGRPADVVTVAPHRFYPVQQYSEIDSVRSFHAEATEICGTFAAVGAAGIYQSVGSIYAEEYALCAANHPIELSDLAAWFDDPPDMSDVRQFDLSPDGLLVVHTATFATYFFDVAEAAKLVEGIVDDLSTENRTVRSLVFVGGAYETIGVSEAADFISAFHAGAHGHLLHAVIITDPDERENETTIVEGVWVNIDGSQSESSGKVSHYELTVPLPGAPAELVAALRVASLAAVLPAEVRKADAKWMAAFDAVAPLHQRFNTEYPPIGASLTELRSPVESGEVTGPCSFEDCVTGQMMADLLAYGPTPAVDSLARGDQDGSGGGGDEPLPENVGRDPRIIGDNRTEIGLSVSIELYAVNIPVGILRNFTLDNVFSSCRGHLRGLTILRLIRASLANPGSSFLQYSGLRCSYLPANTTAGRPDPVIVTADVQSPDTGSFAPIERTRLYSVAASNILALMDAYSPIMGKPLDGDSLPCVPMDQANANDLVRDFVSKRSPLNYTVERRMVPLPGDWGAADAAGAGLLSTESAEVCAGRNAAAGHGGPGLVYDEDLLSCAPCPGHLVANPAADTCVAPPAPPPPPPPPDMVPVFAAAATAVFALFIACVAAAVALLPRWQRRHCPSDASKPFAVAYVSTLNEAALREGHPGGVSRALRLIEKTVAREASVAGCVVAQRLEAHHMLVARDPARALLCAAAVLRALNAVDWASVLHDSTDAARHARIRDRQRGPQFRHQSSSSESQRSTVASSRLHSATTHSKATREARVVAPRLAAALWHGFGTIERDETGGEAFGFRYGGAVAQCAAAAAMSARAWEVALPPATRAAAEDGMWAASGALRPADLCDEDLLADFDPDELPCASTGSAAGSLSGSDSDDGPLRASTAASVGWRARLAPPQLGRCLFVPVGRLTGVSPAVVCEAEGSPHASPTAVEGLFIADVRVPSAYATGSASSSTLSETTGTEGRRREKRGGCGGGTNALAAALSAASGRLAPQRVGVICVYVPGLRAHLPGVSTQSAKLMFTAPDGASPESIVAAALSTAGHSRLVAMLDGYLYFAVNAPDVTTAQVPARAAQDAMAITAAILRDAGAAVSAGVAIGAAFVGTGGPTLGEREGTLKARPPAVAVLGTAADRARVLSRLAWDHDVRHAGHEADEAFGAAPFSVTASAMSPIVMPSEPPILVHSAHAASDDGFVADSAEPTVMVAGDLAAELSGFELQVADVVAWPCEVTSLLRPPRKAAHGAMAAGDIRRRVALAVRVVSDKAKAAEADADGDGEWLYQVGAVCGKSIFSAANAAAASVVRPLGVAADFVPAPSGPYAGADDEELGDPAKTIAARFASLAASLAKHGDLTEEVTKAAQSELIAFACRRFTDSCFLL